MTFWQKLLQTNGFEFSFCSFNCSRPTEDINDVFRRQAMVSLHSSAYPSHDVDPYDSVQDEEEEDLNKLIQEANRYFYALMNRIVRSA